MRPAHSRHAVSPVECRARKLHVPLALAAAAWLAACGDPQPPVACGSIPQQTLHVGETEVVTPCFEDPEMEAVRLTAESSSREVAGASISGDRVRLQANSPGSATITVTATDPDSLTGEVRFEVVVPNRPPELGRTMLDVRLPTGGSRAIFLSEYFVDPDAQELAYRVEFSDPSVVTGTVAGETLIMTAGNAGTATGTVTATDPGGLSFSQTFDVLIVERQRLLRDDFESEESLGNWAVIDSAEARVEDGMFWLENTASGYLGFAAHQLSATGWEVTAALGNATTSAWAGLVVGADHERFSAYMIQIGADGNSFGLGDTDYRFFIFDESGPFWAYDDGFYGQSDAIADVGDLTEVSVTIEGGVLTVTSGSTELVQLDLTGTVLSADATSVTLVTWPAGETTGNRGFFDWVEATGLELGNVGTDMRRAPPSLDLPTPLRQIGPRDWIRRLDSGLDEAGKRAPRAPTGKE